MSKSKRTPSPKLPPAGPTYDQARKIVKKLGGEAAVAKALGISRITPYRWSYGRPRGTDGLVPVAMIEPLRQLAVTLGLELTPEDWFPTKAAS